MIKTAKLSKKVSILWITIKTESNVSLMLITIKNKSKENIDGKEESTVRTESLEHVVFCIC